jgi:CheY-like chemotaxis protein
MTSRTLLVVDPNHSTRTQLRSILEDAGHVVVAASNGPDALLMLEKLSAPAAAFISTEAFMMGGDHFLNSFHAHTKYQGIPTVEIKSKESPLLPGFQASLLTPLTAAAVLTCLGLCS